MRFDGKLKSWNDERGFGFIEPNLGGEQIFVHIKSFPPGTGRPDVGLPLSFEVELGPQGKKRAKAVQLVRTTRAAPSARIEMPAAWTLPRLLILPGFVLVYAFIAWRWRVSPWVAVAYLLVSLITFLAYALDKSAARADRRRIPESSLHWLGLACGWPGALVAQQLLRHKTSKPTFVSSYWGTVVLNIAGFVALHTPVLGSLLARGWGL